MRGTTRSIVVLVAAVLCGCAGSTWPGSPMPQPASPGSRASRAVPPTSSSPIQHIVIMVQENRSFDDLFATYPGADGATTGKLKNGHSIRLRKAHLAAYDINHLRYDFVTDDDGGKMDGFNQSHIGLAPAGDYPYQYVDPTEIAPYWTIANQYVLVDHMFQTQGSGSFTAHQDLIAGGTTFNQNLFSAVDVPSSSVYWGCDAPPGTTTPILFFNGNQQPQGPFPCFRYQGGTLADALDEARVSWKYYTPPHQANTGGAIWNAFDAIPSVRYGPEWKTNVAAPETRVLIDVAEGHLPALSWVIPKHINSDHPRSLNPDVYHGPSWIASVVNAIGQSPYWKSTAIVIVWDDWGGFYDNVPPPFTDSYGGLGFRVPCLIVSPYAPQGSIDHTQYEFGSVLKFVEETFGLRSLGTTDVRATSLAHAFNFSQPPRAFTPIPAPLPGRYFVHQPPSDEPVDSR